MYVISYKPKYKSVLSNNALKIARKISERFEEINYAIWETQWLNEFSQHQTSNQMIVVEIEKEFEESLYYFLNDSLPDCCWPSMRQSTDILLLGLW